MCWRWCDGINAAIVMTGDRRLVIFSSFVFLEIATGKRK